MHGKIPGIFHLKSSGDKGYSEFMFKKICSLSFKKGNIMDILNLIAPILESIGFPVLIFLIWYVYHNSQVKAINKFITINFEILKQMLEVNQKHTETLSRIENKIDTVMDERVMFFGAVDLTDKVIKKLNTGN